MKTDKPPRAFKFRAWDGKTMTHDIGVVDNKAVDFTEEDLWFWHEPPIAIMQSTGLLSKSGTESYREDVIAWGDWAPWDDQVPITKTGIIEWTSGKFVVRCIETGDVEDLCEIGDFEIRGNSFQHPDLLKKE